jgi:hypothetical protein
MLCDRAIDWKSSINRSAGYPDHIFRCVGERMAEEISINALDLIVRKREKVLHFKSEDAMQAHGGPLKSIRNPAIFPHNFPGGP